MTFLSKGQPAIVLVDDDLHSARLMIRMLEAHGAPAVHWVSNTEAATEQLLQIADDRQAAAHWLVLIDLKASSVATRNFVARITTLGRSLRVVAMAPSLDKSNREALIDAGAAAVFERHSDLARYRAEVAAIVSFWVRNQRLNAVGT
ncbi:MAG: response regulator [Devosia sp.]